MKFESVYYVNGKFVNKSHAVVPVNDLGLIRGYGVFDFMVTYNHKPFLLSEHLKRLEQSAKLISIRFVWNKDYLTDVVYKLIQKNKIYKDLQLRFVITGGVSPDNLVPSGEPTLIITAEERHMFSKAYYSRGVKVITCESGRIIPEAKTLNYINAVKANIKAKKVGAIESIYVKDNYILEGTTSNIFVIKREIIYTPKECILPGITREFVLGICSKYYKVRLKKISLNSLYSADEVFITATNKEVMPVTKVDSKQIANGKVGPITSEIMKAYTQLVGKI